MDIHYTQVRQHTSGYPNKGHPHTFLTWYSGYPNTKAGHTFLTWYSGYPNTKEDTLSSLGIVDILTQRKVCGLCVSHTLSSLGIVDILLYQVRKVCDLCVTYHLTCMTTHFVLTWYRDILTWYSGYPNTKVTHFPHLV